MRFIAVFTVIFMAFSSCTWFSEEELYGDIDCDTSNVTYSADIKPIFQENCYSCHSQAAAGTYSFSLLNLENFTEILKEVDNGNLLRNIKHEPGGTPMPQGAAKLSDCKIDKIENWINQGIPNN